MSEREIQKRILLALADAFHPAGIFWTADTGMARSMKGDRKIRFGLPGQSDIQGCMAGRWIGIEVKTEKGKQQENQVAFQHAIERAGGVYIVATSEEQAVEGVIAALELDQEREAILDRAFGPRSRIGRLRARRENLAAKSAR